MGAFGGINIGAKALSAYQVAMQVIGHNISNANTAGYSRQRTEFEASLPDIMSFGAVGRGVEISSIRRIRDAYLDLQMNRDAADLGGWQQKADILSQLELYFQEPSDTATSSLLDNFWQSWQDLSNNPEDTTSRSSVVQQALLLTDNFNELDAKITQLQENLDEALSLKVEQLNDIAGQIADLNTQIVKYEASGDAANDLRDKRDQLVTALASLTDFTMFEQNNGSYSINIDNKPLVWNAEVTQINAELESDGLLHLKWSDTGEPVTPDSGQIGGLLYARDTIIPNYQDKLDTMVNNLIKEVNKMHSQGLGLDGYSILSAETSVADADTALGASGSGLDAYTDIQDGTIVVEVRDSSGNLISTDNVSIDADVTTLNQLAASIDGISNINASVTAGQLSIDADSGYTFTIRDSSTSPSNALMALGINTFFSGTGTNDITVSSTIQNDLNKIAAAATMNPADNTNALALAELRNQTVSALSSTIGSYYASQITGAMGQESKQASTMEENQQLIVDQLYDSIQETSGVSLDEEMTALMQYQHSYTAAAKYISLVGQMLDDLVNII